MVKKEYHPVLATYSVATSPVSTYLCCILIPLQLSPAVTASSALLHWNPNNDVQIQTILPSATTPTHTDEKLQWTCQQWSCPQQETTHSLWFTVTLRSFMQLMSLQHILKAVFLSLKIHWNYINCANSWRVTIIHRA